MQELFVGKKAKELKTFEGIYKNFPQKNFEYTMLNITEDGTLILCNFMPYIQKIEIDYFMNRKAKFYNFDIDNTISATLIRGSVSCDQIIEPMYSDNRIDLIAENKTMIMVMVDTATDEVKAFRMCLLPDRVCEKIVENANKIKQASISKDKLFETFKNEILTRTPERLEKLGRYIGKEINSITAEIMFFPDCD